MGEETDNVVESTSKLQSKLEALTGVDILTDSGAYKDTYTILKEIAAVWKDIDPMDQAAALELMAGKNRANTLAAILNNMKDLENAYETALDADGSAIRENAAYLDSIQGRIDLFTNALQTMWANLINSNVIKSVVDTGTGLIKFLDTAIGKISALSAIVAGFYGKHKLDKEKIDLSELIFEIAPEKIKNSLSNLKGSNGPLGVFISTLQKTFNEEMKSRTTTINISELLANLVNFDDANQIIDDLVGAFDVESMTEKQVKNILDSFDGLSDITKEAVLSSIGKISAQDLMVELANYDDASGDILSSIAESLGINGENLLSTFISKDQVTEVLESFDGISDTTKEAILNSELFGITQVGAAAGTDFLTIALAKAKVGIIAFGNALKAAFISHPILMGIAAIAVAITAAIAITDALTTSHEEYVEILNEETQALKSVQNELKNVQTELQNINDRMIELKAKGTLSFVEEEELNRLKEQTAELERQEAILLAQEKRAKEKQVKTALNTIKSDSNLKKQAGGSYLADRASTYAQAQGIEYNTIKYDAYETNLINLAKAKQELADAEKALLDSDADSESKEYKKLSKNYESAKNAVEEYNQALDDLDTDWQTKYGEVGHIANATSDAEKEWNEFWRQHQDYLDQQALLNDTYGKSTVLDRVFGATATDAAKEFKEKFEAGIKSGKDPAAVVEELISSGNYSSMLSDLENKFKITAQHIQGYFTQTGEFAVEDREFNIANYTNSISTLQKNISTYQEALEKLESGSFTMSDFIALIEEFPDLANGVDVSSKSFNGLSKNLKKAIKNSPDDLVDDLKDLKKQLAATGKSTDAIDQLIESLENMPEDAVQSMTDKYSTLEDKINDARIAQNKLAESMEENPNEGFETRGEAMEYMKEAMTRGEIGSESNLWNVAEQYGFTYNSAQSINENADALATFIAKREQWFAQDDDGNYTYTGIEEFIEDVEAAVEANEELASILKWNYDESTGIFNFDFDNENWDEIVKYLSESEELVGLTSDEFSDLLTQIGQYFGISWGDNKDAMDHLQEIADGAGDATEKIKEYAKYMQLYFGKGDVDLTNRPMVGSQAMQDAGWDNVEDGSYATVNSVTYYKSDFQSVNAGEEDTAIVLTPILPDGSVISPEQLEKYAQDILNGEEIDIEGITLGVFDDKSELNEFEEYLHQAQELYQLLQDPLNINTTIEEDGIEGLTKITELQDAIKQGSQGTVVINTDALTAVLKDAGYTKAQIDDLIKKIQEYNNIVTVTPADPLGLYSQNASIKTVMDSLEVLGIQYEVLRGTLENPERINIQAPDLIEVLKNSGWTTADITAYIQTLTTTTDGTGVAVNGIVNMDATQVQEVIDKMNEVPEEEHVVVEITTNGAEELSAAVSDANSLKSNYYSKVTIDTYENKYQKNHKWNAATGKYEVYANGTAHSSGTAHANGTAYSSGSWGAAKTETALVGELGTELVVRNGRWFTVGDNGAEFTQVKKGDIIFNHKQTESLFKNGYVTGRGKAYAEGTAYVSGGGAATRYTFNGNGTWSNSDLSNLSDSLSNSVDGLKETFDWIEVRIEELDEVLGLLEAELENAVYYTNKNNIIDDIIAANNTKLDNLQAGYQEYADYAAKLLTEIPEQYREAAKNGAIAITEFVSESDEATKEAIENYREWAQKSADLKQQAEELLTTIRDLVIQKFDNAYTAGDVRATVEDSQTEKLQNQVDLLETMGEVASAVYYGINNGKAEGSTGMFENAYKKIEYLTEARNAMQNELNRAVESGQIIRGSNEWYELVDQMYQVDAQIHEAVVEIEEFQNAINDIYWDNFDELINRLDYISNETQNLIDLMGNVDLVTTPDAEDGWSSEDVEWTKEGLASLGLYAQQMEVAEYQAKQYANAISDLGKDYKAGKYSESEYLEKLNELKDAQYDSIQAYYDARDAIKDLNKTRVDEIKNGINKQIDAYEKLINKKKELLNSEKD